MRRLSWKRMGCLLVSVLAPLGAFYLLLAPRLWMPVRHIRVLVDGALDDRVLLHRGPSNQLALFVSDSRGGRIYVIRTRARQVVVPDVTDFWGFGGALISGRSLPTGVLLGKSAYAEVTPNLKLEQHSLSFRGLYGESIQVTSQNALEP